MTDAQAVVNPQDRADGGEVWGKLHRDTAALDSLLGDATHAVYRAAQAAMWVTESGGIIHSPLADLLGGLSTVIDALIDQREEAKLRGARRGGGSVWSMKPG